MPTFDKYMAQIQSSKFKDHIAKYKEGISEVRKLIEERKQLLAGQGKKLNLKPSPKIHIDLRAAAKDLEQNRHEYVEVVTRINESNKIANRPRVTNQYESRANQIQDCLSNINNFEQIIYKAQAEKDKLGIFKGNEKRKLQETIDRAKQSLQQQIGKLKELGLEDRNKAHEVITKLKEKHEVEKQTVIDFNNGIKALRERAEKIKDIYQEKKLSLSEEQREVVAEYQKELRPDEHQGDKASLERTQAELQANRELEPKEQRTQTREKTKEMER